jgi:hypothetical protein
MAKQKRRNRRRLIVISGLAAVGTGAAAAARAQRKRTAEPASESPADLDESRMHRIADRVKSALNAGKGRVTAAAHKLRHPTGTSTA